MTRNVSVTAPVRVADLGGWTDTWFAGHGAVCHVAMCPGVTVRLSSRRADAGPRLAIDVVDFGERYELPDGGAFRQRHALLAAAIDAAPLAPDRSCHLSLSSSVPPGASLGTSAAVVVAVLAAFDAMAGVFVEPPILVARAHAVEVRSLGRQSGVQDQIAAVNGGINFVEILQYPETRVEGLILAEPIRHALDGRLLVVYLGQGHDSSAIHDEVIASIGRDAARRRALDVLRALARLGRKALLAGDLDEYGRILPANCAQQMALHASLVNEVAAGVIDVARSQGACGWKVNGAGGDGGSVTLLCGQSPDARALLARRIEADIPGARVLPLRLSATGVTVRVE